MHRQLVQDPKDRLTLSTITIDEYEVAYLTDFLHDALRQPGSYTPWALAAGEKLLELLEKS